MDLDILRSGFRDRPKRLQKAKKRNNKKKLLIESCTDFKILKELEYYSTYDDTDDDYDVKFKEVKPRSENQCLYLNYIKNKDIDIVIGIGKPGSGKTYIAVSQAIKEVFELKNYKKIVITRPVVTCDESLGYLKGGLNEKMAPFMQPIYDVFSEYMSQEDINYYLGEKVIEVLPFAFIRGRNLQNSIILLDESQNCTISQMKAFLTRIAEGSKVIITGDIHQSDLNYSNNGLIDFINRYKKFDINRKKSIKLVEFKNSDIVRHPIISVILDMYEENNQMEIDSTDIIKRI